MDDIKKSPPFMFSRPFIDYFFRWNWWVVPLIFLPISFSLFFFGMIRSSVNALILVILFVCGLFSWTFFEYCMHRFLFHTIGHSCFLNHLHYVIHGMHHAYPTDPLRVIFPPFGSFIIGGIIGFMLFFLLSPQFFAVVYAGFIIGYIWYEFMHYAAHHIKWKILLFKRLKRHHLLHHYNHLYKEQNFGVSTTLWDRIFKTYLA
jgi:4-hydroxysphinganine ceramide fatty acyl 2-hydroxylase